MATVSKTGRRPDVAQRNRERATKDAIIADLLRAHGCVTTDELKAKLEAIDRKASEPAKEGTRLVGRKVVTGGKDALAFIDADCPYVPLVSSTAIFVLRPGKRRHTPPIERITLKAGGRARPWYACPFYIGDRSNIVNDSNLKVFKEAWHHLVLPKHVAEAVYADPRWPKPATAVVDPERFAGWDPISRDARGERADIAQDFVALREVTRRLLQKGSDTFLNWLEMPSGYTFDRRIPNPYRNRITDVPVEFPSPRDFVAEEK